MLQLALMLRWRCHRCPADSPDEPCVPSRGTKRPLTVNQNSRLRCKLLSKVLKFSLIKRSVCPSAVRKSRFLYSSLFLRLCFAFITVILSSTSPSSSSTSPGPFPRGASLVTAMGSMSGSAKPSARIWWILSIKAVSVSLAPTGAASVSFALTGVRLTMIIVTSGVKGSRGSVSTSLHSSSSSRLVICDKSEDTSSLTLSTSESIILLRLSLGSCAQ